jgi:hypothetical protein
VIRVTRFRGTLPACTTRCVLVLLLIAMATPLAENAAPAKHRHQEIDPAELIRRASYNEVSALQSPGHFRYFERLEWSWGSETRDVMETPQGRADRIVQFDDQPLAPDQAAKQERRLALLLRDAKAARHEMEDQRAELKRRIKMMKAFPSAFIFELEGEQDGLLEFSFRPNRSFSPKDRETQVYRGMQGTVWVDPEQEMLTRIDGTLTRDVSFGWGIFGRLHKGGHYHLEQRQVEPGVWRITTLALDLKLRVFLDTYRLLRRERNMQFTPMAPDITYTRAVETLLESPAEPDR